MLGVKGKVASSQALKGKSKSEPVKTIFPKTSQQLPKRHQPFSLYLSDSNQKKACLEDLVYVRYLDHVLFKNSNHSLLAPVLRETVGFLTKQTYEAIWVLWDRSINASQDEKTSFESGLIILRNDIRKIKKIVV
jgi:hypothetical protein